MRAAVRARDGGDAASASGERSGNCQAQPPICRRRASRLPSRNARAAGSNQVASSCCQLIADVPSGGGFSTSTAAPDAARLCQLSALRSGAAPCAASPASHASGRPAKNTACSGCSNGGSFKRVSTTPQPQAVEGRQLPCLAFAVQRLRSKPHLRFGTKPAQRALGSIARHAARQRLADEGFRGGITRSRSEWRLEAASQRRFRAGRRSAPPNSRLKASTQRAASGGPSCSQPPGGKCTRLMPATTCSGVAKHRASPGAAGSARARDGNSGNGRAGSGPVQRGQHAGTPIRRRRQAPGAGQQRR